MSDETTSLHHFNRRTQQLTCGKLARLAGGSCVGRSGDTHVMVTVVSNNETAKSSSFMPFTVDYRQKASGCGQNPYKFFAAGNGVDRKGNLDIADD